MGKRTRPAFVPGQILVRYRTEAVAKVQSRSTTLQRSNGLALPIQVEHFQGSELVAGLRLARVAPEETMQAIAALRQQPDVLYAEPNYILHADVTPDDSHFSDLYGMTKIGAPIAWDSIQGSSSIVIGVVDQGIDLNHPDLQNNIWVNPATGLIPGITNDLHGYNFIDNTGTIPAGEEHATHVAGIAGAVGSNHLGVTGVNWHVGLMSLRFLDADGSGSDLDAIRAYNYARQMRDLWVSNHSQGADIRVLNNSFGGGGFSQATFDAIKALNQSGILFVASNGNEAQNSDISPHYPSGYDSPNVISVASTNSSDLLSSFSNFGIQTCTIGAPGSAILSTTPQGYATAAYTDPSGYTYTFFSGTSMASPHVSGAAALLAAKDPSLTVQKLRSLLIFNGDVLPSLSGKTLTGRRLNVASSLQALNEADTTPPGSPTNFASTNQVGRSLTVSWNTSGDDNQSGQAALYQLTFTDGKTGETIPLKSVIPLPPNTSQSVDVKIPFRHTTGTISLREFDNVGNEGTPVSLPVSVSLVEGDPYATTLGNSVALSSGGTGLSFNCDDCYKTTNLPFAFPYFGQSYNSVKVSSNGNIFFEPPTAPTRSNGEADDVPSSTADLSRFKMISGLWDDLDLRTSSRSDADVFVVQDSTRIILRWQGVPCNFDGNVCTGGAPVNFEIELRNDGTIKSRYGSGNTGLFPVVGISGGEPDAYVIPSHTSERTPTNLTNAVEVTYIPRNVINPLENNFFFVSQQYRDLLNREPDLGGLGYWTSALNDCGTDQICLTRHRVGVSAAFFIELEFQRTGSFVVRSFKGGLGRQPSYLEFSADRPQIVEGPNLEQTKQAYELAFVQRPEFVNKYAAATSRDTFVEALINNILANSQVDLSGMRQALRDKYDTGANMNQSRAFALRDAIDAPAFQNAEFNKAFVLMQYFGYLGRDIDQAGYDFWLDVLNNRVPGNFQGMVCAFITSAEYQQRFSSLTPHSDHECGPPAF